MEGERRDVPMRATSATISCSNVNRQNLSLVIEYLHDNHPDVFADIVGKLKSRVPGISEVESKQTEEGRILLRFRDGAFEDPFLARNVSDGTIKMLAYLTLLHDNAYQKVAGSRAIGPHLSLDANKSHSFRVFLDGVRRAALP